MSKNKLSSEPETAVRVPLHCPTARLLCGPLTPCLQLQAGELLLVVGTAAGDVRAVSAATGELAWAIQGCNEGCGPARWHVGWRCEPMPEQAHSMVIGSRCLPQGQADTQQGTRGLDGCCSVPQTHTRLID